MTTYNFNESFALYPLYILIVKLKFRRVHINSVKHLFLSLIPHDRVHICHSKFPRGENDMQTILLIRKRIFFPQWFPIQQALMVSLLSQSIVRRKMDCHILAYFYFINYHSTSGIFLGFRREHCLFFLLILMPTKIFVFMILKV